MNIRDACVALELDYTTIWRLNKDDVHKQYLKVALKTHPDKTHTSDPRSFQYLRDAYEYIQERIFNDEQTTACNPLPSYLQYVCSYIRVVVSNKTLADQLCMFIRQIRDSITPSTANISAIVSTMSKDHLMEMFCFFIKYSDVINIPDIWLSCMEDELKRKASNDIICIFRPTLDDLISGRIYRLTVDSNVYLVPMWNTELFYDNKTEGIDAEIIVMCKPELPPTVSVDEMNNIYCEWTVQSTLELFTLENIEVNVAGTVHLIPVRFLYIRPVQQYIIYGKGIPRVAQNDPFAIHERGDIVITIYMR